MSSPARNELTCTIFIIPYLVIFVNRYKSVEGRLSLKRFKPYHRHSELLMVVDSSRVNQLNCYITPKNAQCKYVRSGKIDIYFLT